VLTEAALNVDAYGNIWSAALVVA